jgi:hypothetical protein
MPDGGDQSLDVVVVESGGGVAQVDGDAVGEAGRQQEDTPFAGLTELRGVAAAQATGQPQWRIATLSGSS